MGLAAVMDWCGFVGTTAPKKTLERRVAAVDRDVRAAIEWRATAQIQIEVQSLRAQRDLLQREYMRVTMERPAPPRRVTPEDSYAELRRAALEQMQQVTSMYSLAPCCAPQRAAMDREWDRVHGVHPDQQRMAQMLAEIERLAPAPPPTVMESIQRALDRVLGATEPEPELVGV
jgi:hypothetical protein